MTEMSAEVWEKELREGFRKKLEDPDKELKLQMAEAYIAGFIQAWKICNEDPRS